nr:hypothetical protein [Myxococcus sp. AM011]
MAASLVRSFELRGATLTSRSVNEPIKRRWRFPCGVSAAGCPAVACLRWSRGGGGRFPFRAAVRRQGERMLFLYGENDPWSAGPFEVRERNDSFRFYVPDSNHINASITRLPEAERTLALSRLSTWMGVTPPAVGAQGLAVESPADVAPLVEARSRL